MFWACFGCGHDLCGVCEGTGGTITFDREKDSTVKGRTVFDEKPMREWLSEEGSTSPTASLESVAPMAVIDAHEERET